MSSLSFAVILHTSILLTGADNYADAHKATLETGQPMVVMVGADWCPACQEMKTNVIPRIREHGLLRRVAFAVVNVDRERELGRQLTGGGPIPQLLMYRKAADGWKLRRLIGSQTVNTVESFIHEGVAVQEEAKKTEAVQAAQPPATTSASEEPLGHEAHLSKSHG